MTFICCTIQKTFTIYTDTTQIQTKNIIFANSMKLYSLTFENTAIFKYIENSAQISTLVQIAVFVNNLRYVKY